MKDVVMITGASRGIGKELAYVAARDGYDLLLVARDEVALEEVKKTIQKESPDLAVLTHHADLTKSETVNELVVYCTQKEIHVTQLINNAGFGDYGIFDKSDLKRQLAMIDLNIRSLTELTHRFLPPMIKRGSGKIMNLGSVAGFLPGPKMSVYFASKNYVLAFSEALSQELQGSGVFVTCFCPGSTRTDFGKNARVSNTHSTANTTVLARDVALFGWKALQRRKRVAVYGVGNRVLLKLVNFIPRTVLTKLIDRIQ